MTISVSSFKAVGVVTGALIGLLVLASWAYKIPNAIDNHNDSLKAHAVEIQDLKSRTAILEQNNTELKIELRSVKDGLLEIKAQQVIMASKLQELNLSLQQINTTLKFITKQENTF